jgi:hypothetical protein
MLSDLLTQKFLQKKRLLIFDTSEHVDSEKLNRQIDFGPPLYQLFSKRDLHVAKIGKNWLI